MEVFYLGRILIGCFCLLLGACQANVDTTREVEMYNQSGDMVGTAIFTEHPEGVEIELNVEGLVMGFHGLHVHEYPVCEGPDFKSAGNHFNPDNKQHGLLHPDGAHVGDLFNVEADENGVVDVKVIVEEATLLKGKNSLLQNEGTSLIVTEDPDDGMSQPGGASGTRLICGELKGDEEEETAFEQPTDPTEITEENHEEENSL